MRDEFYKCEDYFFRAISKQCLDFEGMGTAYLTGIGSAYLNPLFLRKNQSPLKDVLEKVKSFYEAYSCPWAVIIPKDLTKEVHIKGLRSFDFHLCEKSVAMAIELGEHTKFESSQWFEIKRVDHDLKDWMIPLGGAFGGTQEMTRHYAEIHVSAVSKKAQFYHFTAYDKNLPVSSLTLSLDQKSACLNDVGTLPEFQKRGFASSLILYALSEAQKLGATACFLDASVVGFSLYQRLGFTPLFKNNIFLEKSK
ncbi:MAG TPA: GNAT family N-acetyltransferase [Alphaproteobacteria bacterium]|nr:GNAT family N-acetyltransferase [Alphaproteobacteria bacterium]